MVNLGTPSYGNGIGPKTGLSVDGRDPGMTPSTYLTDLGTLPQQGSDPPSDRSTKRPGDLERPTHDPASLTAESASVLVEDRMFSSDHLLYGLGAGDLREETRRRAQREIIPVEEWIARFTTSDASLAVSREKSRQPWAQ